MKNFNLLLVAFAMCISFNLSAQFEAKINPIGALFNSPTVGLEYIVSDDIGVEAIIGIAYGDAPLAGITDLRQSGFNIRLAGKYYFNPDDGADKFYVGVYTGPKSRKYTDEEIDNFNYGYKVSAFTAGLLGGFKWVSNRNIIFELGLGVGRAFGETYTYFDEDNTRTVDGFEFDIFARISLGYRF